eukprot:1868503-Pyramimonas_sp.AAC.1
MDVNKGYAMAVKGYAMDAKGYESAHAHAHACERSVRSLSLSLHTGTRPPNKRINQWHAGDTHRDST